MKTDEIENILRKMAKATDHRPANDLAENIIQQIPQSLREHRPGRGTINIMINLRINRIAAAAIIIFTLILFLQFFPLLNNGHSNLIQDSRMWVKAWASKAGSQQKLLEQTSNLYQLLLDKGKEITYYGDSIGPQAEGSILMHWKVDDNNYIVIFGDLSKDEVSAEKLIEIQSKMLQNRKISGK